MSCWVTLTLGLSDVFTLLNVVLHSIVMKVNIELNVLFAPLTIVEEASFIVRLRGSIWSEMEPKTGEMEMGMMDPTNLKVKIRIKTKTRETHLKAMAIKIKGLSLAIQVSKGTKKEPINLQAVRIVNQMETMEDNQDNHRVERKSTVGTARR